MFLHCCDVGVSVYILEWLLLLVVNVYSAVPPPTLHNMYYIDILSFRLLSFYLGCSRASVGQRMCCSLVSGYVRCHWMGQFELPPMACPCPGICLDRLNVIGRVQSLLPVVQTTSTPALLVLILSFGQFISWERERQGSSISGGWCWLSSRTVAVCPDKGTADMLGVLKQSHWQQGANVLRDFKLFKRCVFNSKNP